MTHDDIKNNVLQWNSRGDYRIRIKKVSNGMSTVWISISGVNLCIPLMMHEFIQHCDEVLSLHVEIDSSWNGQKGFKLKSNDIDFFLDETIKFINEWDIEPSDHVKKIPEEEWFSDR